MINLVINLLLIIMQKITRDKRLVEDCTQKQKISKRFAFCKRMHRIFFTIKIGQDLLWQFNIYIKLYIRAIN